MSARPVQAVFFWPLEKISIFRPIYGRLGSQGGYTKDFLQSPQAQWRAIDAALGRTAGIIPVTFRWPGGEEPNGQWRQSAADTRGQLAWPTNAPPAPWRVGDPSTDPIVTIPGDPTKTDPVQADAVHTAILASGIKPWLVAVKLADEENILNLRVYLENPPAGLEERSTAVLPISVRQALADLPSSQGGGSINISRKLAPRAPELVTRIQEALRREPNVLLVGPPGTGKTVALEDLRALYETTILFDPDVWDDAWTDSALGDSRKAVSLVFHPSYGYENFVAGLIPGSSTTGVGFELRTQPGPLISLSHWSSSPGRESLLIIDEFNRGPAAAVFGDTIALLDAEKRAGPRQRGVAITRPYPLEQMEVSDEFANHQGNRLVGNEISLPTSLSIVGAMNSTDRSVAPIDAALRRRFSIIHVGPDYAVLAKHISTIVPDTATPFVAGPPWSVDKIRELTMRVIMTINARIEQILGRDYLLGHALLWSVKGGHPQDIAKTLTDAVEERIFPTLRMTFMDQEDALAAIIAIGPQPAGFSAMGRWQAPSSALSAVAPARLSLTSLSDISTWEDRLQALASLLDE